MFDSQKTGHARWLAVGLIFSPAILMISRPIEYVTLALAIACSALCVTLGWTSSKQFDPFSIFTMREAKTI